MSSHLLTCTAFKLHFPTHRNFQQISTVSKRFHWMWVFSHPFPPTSWHISLWWNYVGLHLHFTLIMETLIASLFLTYINTMHVLQHKISKQQLLHLLGSSYLNSWNKLNILAQPISKTNHQLKLNMPAALAKKLQPIHLYCNIQRWLLFLTKFVCLRKNWTIPVKTGEGCVLSSFIPVSDVQTQLLNVFF